MRAGTASRVLLPESRRRVFFLACVRVHGPASLQPASSSSSPPSWLQLVEVVASSFVMAESSNHSSRPLQLSSKPRPHMTKLPRRVFLLTVAGISLAVNGASTRPSFFVASRHRLLHHGISFPGRAQLHRGRGQLHCGCTGRRRQREREEERP